MPGSPTWWAASPEACWAPPHTACPTWPASEQEWTGIWKAMVGPPPSSWFLGWLLCSEPDEGSEVWGSAHAAHPRSSSDQTPKHSSWPFFWHCTRGALSRAELALFQHLVSDMGWRPNGEAQAQDHAGRLRDQADQVEGSRRLFGRTAAAGRDRLSLNSF